MTKWFVIGIIILVILTTIGLGVYKVTTDNKKIQYEYITKDFKVEDGKVKDIYIDNLFNDEEVKELEWAINEWNKALNGNLKLNIAGKFDRKNKDLTAKVANGEIYVVIRLEWWSELVKNEKNEKTQGFTDKIGGNLVYLIPDEIKKGNLDKVFLHEIGHLMGAKHNGNKLMTPQYSGFSCIDKETMQNVCEYNKWNFESIIYCVEIKN